MKIRCDSQKILLLDYLFNKQQKIQYFHSFLYCYSHKRSDDAPREEWNEKIVIWQEI